MVFKFLSLTFSFRSSCYFYFSLVLPWLISLSIYFRYLPFFASLYFLLFCCIQPHMFHFSRFERAAPVFPFFHEISRFDYTFYKLDWNILAGVLLLVTIFIISSRSGSIKAHLFFWHWRKKGQGQVWESVRFVIFKPWKVLQN